MQINKEVTIYDIAEKLQLSSSLISRALRNHQGINPGTKKQILETAESLGYRANSFASQINSIGRKTNTIGIIVPKLNSSFMATVIAGVEKALTKAGYALVITHSAGSHEKEVAKTQNLFHSGVDGLIVSLSSVERNLAHFKPFEDRGIPIVFVDNVPLANRGIKVVIDNYLCGYQVTRHLIDQGCTKIVLVTGSLEKNVYNLRYKGYKDALASCQIPYAKERIIIGSLDEKSSEQAALDILNMQPRPDGIFITNDFAAAICLNTLKKHGIKIPGDIAIAGFNNDLVSQVVQPQLTTINYPGDYLGETAACQLLNHLNGLPNNNIPGTIVINSGLIIRGSSLRRRI